MADKLEKTYKNQNPIATATYVGFVNDEDQSVLSGKLEFTFGNLETDVVGIYNIKLKGLNSNNYDITYSDGTITVNPMKVKTSATGNTKQIVLSLDKSVPGIKISDITIKTGETVVASRSIRSNSDNTEYTILATLSNEMTYTIVTVKDNYEIDDATFTVIEQSSGSGSSSSSSVVTPTITVEKSDGGKISISTDKKSITIIPDDGYAIANVIVDGKGIGSTEKYIFADSKNHRITPVFVKETMIPYYIKDNQKVYIGFSDITKNLYKIIIPNGVNIEFGENPKNFKDNIIAWAKSSIDFVTEREIFLGTSQDMFSPNESMTRAMFVTVIGRLYERSHGIIAGTSTFSDVDTNSYYAKYVAWGNNKGIIKGVGENKFAPNDEVTREQMAVIIMNFATFLEEMDGLDSSLEYTDSKSISSWAVEGAKYCQKTKVITGRNSGNFAPQESATRAEVAAVIERFIKKILKY